MKTPRFVAISYLGLFVIVLFVGMVILGVIAYSHKKQSKQFNKEVVKTDSLTIRLLPDHAIFFSRKETVDYLRIFSSVQKKYANGGVYVSKDMDSTLAVSNSCRGNLIIPFDTLQSILPIASMHFKTISVEKNKNTKGKKYNLNCFTFDFYYLAEQRIGYAVVRMNTKYLDDLFFFEDQIKNLN